MGRPAPNRLHFQELLTCRQKLLIPMALLFFCLNQSGCVGPGSLGVSPSNVNFGTVAIGSRSSQVVTITNSGSGPFAITQAAVSGKGFQINPPSLPLTLAVGQSAHFTATFTPAAIGNTSGSVLITKVQNTAPQLSSGSGSGATTTVSTEQATIAMAGTGVSAAPAITTQPASETVSTGQTAVFSVTSSGVAPLSYQWNKNGTPVSGATSSAYTTAPVAASDSGSQYSVVVSNSAGNVTSNVATLTVGGAGQLAASTTKLNYGNVTVGTTDTLPVTLTNSGNSSVSISNVTLSGAGLSVSGVSSGLILAAGNSATMNLTFAPSASGSLNGSVTVSSNATDPTVTIDLSGTAVQLVTHSVTLSLAPNSSNVAGYNVYRSSTSNGPYTKLNSPLVTSTTYTDTAVLAKQTYFYVGTAVDSVGNETGYSSQVSATIPTP
jgi:hypothetical protein